VPIREEIPLKAEIIPKEPGQVMLPREKKLKSFARVSTPCSNLIVRFLSGIFYASIYSKSY